ncbi:MAG TPA: diguanylate cyclase, partial [Candidatus Dormibacteraeota bacterium]
MLAAMVGIAGLAAGLLLPPPGMMLAWFIPLVDGATVLSLVVAASIAGIDVIVRQERSALPYVALGAIVAPLWLAHLLAFTGMVPAPAIGAAGGVLFHLGHIAMPVLIIWVLLQPAGPLSNPRGVVTSVVAFALVLVTALVAVSLAVPSIPLSLTHHFTVGNAALLGVEGVAVAVAIFLFASGRRGDSRFEAALTAALILLAFEAIVQLLSKAPYDAAWYAAAALRVDPALLLMAGLLSLYGPSLRAQRLAEGRHRMLEELDANLRLSVEVSPVAVMATDGAGVVTAWNPRAEAIFGWSAPEAIGQPLWTLIAPSDWQKTLRRRVRRLIRAGWHHAPQATELTGLHRDGRAFPIELILAARQGPGGNAVLVCLARQLDVPNGDALPAGLRVAVTEPLVTSPTWAEAAPRVLQGICEELDWDVGELWAVEREADVLYLEHSWHQSASQLELFASKRSDLKISRGKGLIGTVWKTGNAYWSSDLSRDRRVIASELIAGSRLHSGGAFAIRNQTGTIGVLALFTRRRVRLDRFRLQRLDELARDLGGLIERKRSEDAMRASGQRIRAVLDHVVDGLITFDENGRIESFNPSAQQLLGYEAGEIMGQDLKLLIAESHRSEFLGQLKGILRPGRRPASSAAYETQGRRKDGSTFPLEFSINQVRLGNGRLYLGLLRDVTERKAQTEALEYRALHDSLTSLPNRTFLADRLEQTLLSAQRERQPRAYLVLDLNGFKQVNDSLGHDQGDRVLQELARRLRRVLRKADTVARVGGDEFAILPAGVTDTPRAILIAEKVLDALEPPFQLGEHTVEIGSSIGIAVYPEHGEDATTLTRNADIAMYVAKRARTGYSVYAPDQGTYPPMRQPLISTLGAAIDQLELLLHYQPIVDVRTGVPQSVEALVRWGHPKHGLLLPNDFVPAAEQTELIHPLTAWVLNEAMRQAHAWQTAGIDLAVAVNLSARNLLDPDLVDT